MTPRGSVVEEGPLGPRLVLAGAWDPKVGQWMQKQAISGLVLNYARGWTDRTIDWLAGLDFLTELDLIRWDLEGPLTPIESLTNLRVLALTCDSDDTISFSELEHLESVAIAWDNADDDVFQCRRLRRLYTENLPDADFGRLASCVALESVGLVDPLLESLVGIEGLGNLRSLELAGAGRLEDLSQLQSCTRLKECSIVETHGLADLDVLPDQSAVEKLILNDNGEIRSLGPLRSQANLDWLVFAGSTNIVDGDLSVLLELPRLRTIAFKNRRHYSHKLKEIQRVLGGG